VSIEQRAFSSTQNHFELVDSRSSSALQKNDAATVTAVSVDTETRMLTIVTEHSPTHLHNDALPLLIYIPPPSSVRNFYLLSYAIALYSEKR